MKPSEAVEYLRNSELVEHEANELILIVEAQARVAAAAREFAEYCESYYHPEVLKESKRTGCKFQNELLRQIRYRANVMLKSLSVLEALE